jgi:diguanylate cyclase (GGDEF)-like protein
VRFSLANPEPVSSSFERKTEHSPESFPATNCCGTWLDHFKEVNDRCGHLVGDAVLSMIGSCLRRQLRSYDVVARFGGDEFAAICCDCTPDGIDAPI